MPYEILKGFSRLRGNHEAGGSIARSGLLGLETVEKMEAFLQDAERVAWRSFLRFGRILNIVDRVREKACSWRFTDKENCCEQQDKLFALIYLQNGLPTSTRTKRLLRGKLLT